MHQIRIEFRSIKTLVNQFLFKMPPAPPIMSDDIPPPPPPQNEPIVKTTVEEDDWGDQSHQVISLCH